MNLQKTTVYGSKSYFNTSFSSRTSYFVDLTSNYDGARLEPDDRFCHPLKVFFILNKDGAIPDLVFNHRIGAFQRYFEDADKGTVEHMLTVKDLEHELISEWIELVRSEKFPQLEEKILIKLAETLLELARDSYKMSYLASNQSLKAKLAKSFTLSQIKFMDEHCTSEFTQEVIWFYRLKIGWNWEYSDGREFAQKVAGELLSFGLRQNQAWEVIRACGPGHVKVALAYAEAFLVSAYNPDLIWLLFGGAKGAWEKNGCGYSRTVKALVAAGINVPEEIFTSATAFFKILRGTRLLVRFLSKKGSVKER